MISCHLVRYYISIDDIKICIETLFKIPFCSIIRNKLHCGHCLGLWLKMLGFQFTNSIIDILALRIGQQYTSNPIFYFQYTFFFSYILLAVGRKVLRCLLRFLFLLLCAETAKYLNIHNYRIIIIILNPQKTSKNNI